MRRRQAAWLSNMSVWYVQILQWNHITIKKQFWPQRERNRIRFPGHRRVWTLMTMHFSAGQEIRIWCSALLKSNRILPATEQHAGRTMAPSIFASESTECQITFRPTAVDVRLQKKLTFRLRKKKKLYGLTMYFKNWKIRLSSTLL